MDKELLFKTIKQQIKKSVLTNEHKWSFYSDENNYAEVISMVPSDNEIDGIAMNIVKNEIDKLRINNPYQFERIRDDDNFFKELLNRTYDNITTANSFVYMYSELAFDISTGFVISIDNGLMGYFNELKNTVYKNPTFDEYLENIDYEDENEKISSLVCKISEEYPFYELVRKCIKDGAFIEDEDGEKYTRYLLYSTEMIDNYYSCFGVTICSSGSMIINRAKIIDSTLKPIDRIEFMIDKDDKLKITNFNWYIFNEENNRSYPTSFCENIGKINDKVYSSFYNCIFPVLNVIDDLLERKVITKEAEKVYHYKEDHEHISKISERSINYSKYTDHKSINIFYPENRKSPRFHRRKDYFRFNPKTGEKDIYVRSTTVGDPYGVKTSYTDTEPDTLKEPIPDPPQVVEEKIPIKKKRKLDPETRAEVIDLYLSDEKLSNTEIGAKVGISPSSVNKIIKRYEYELAEKEREETKVAEEKVEDDNMNNKKRSKNKHQRKIEVTNWENSIINKAEENVEDFIIMTSEFDHDFDDFGLEQFNLTQFSNKNIVQCGLVADRHDIKIDKFIFEEALSEELMFDYDEQERICREFINNNIKFENGKATQKLVIYTTGMQCALGSISKVTEQMKVDLTLKHYNSRLKKYSAQIIRDTMSISSSHYYFDDLAKNKPLFFYNCTVDDFSNNEEFYMLTLSMYEKEDNCKCKNSMLICLRSYEDIWTIYPTLVQNINKSSNNLAVFVASCNLDNGIFNWNDNITKGYNFK